MTDSESHTESPPIIQGIYEACIGVDDLQSQIDYWSSFGYQVSARGQLDADQAQRLYGVRSALESAHLTHQEADHGLIRLMRWEEPTGLGTGLAPMRARGGRWVATLTEDIMRLMNHAHLTRAQGKPIYAVPPQWAVIYQPETEVTPFKEPLVGIREMFLGQPLTRQILFQRFNYKIHTYGQINQEALFKTSQVTHFGLIVQSDDPEITSFYEETLGLMFVRKVEDTYEKSEAGRVIFDLKPGERYFSTDYDDPRSDRDDYTKARSGRLKVIRFESAYPLHEGEYARPGDLGLTLYTLRVSDLSAYHERLTASEATHVSELCVDEFGARAFSFRSPDGYDWTLIEDLHMT